MIHDLIGSVGVIFATVNDFSPLLAVIIAILGPIFTYRANRKGIDEEAKQRQALESKVAIMGEELTKMASAAETMAKAAASRSDIESAEAEALKACRWQLSIFSSAPDRVVYELVNNSSSVAQNVTVTVPEKDTWRKLPDNQKMDPWQKLKFIQLVTTEKAEVSAMNVSWATGEENVPVRGA